MPRLAVSDAPPCTQGLHHFLLTFRKINTRMLSLTFSASTLSYNKVVSECFLLGGDQEYVCVYIYMCIYTVSRSM